MTKTFTIRGQKIRSASNRRFIVVACRPADYAVQRQTGRVIDGQIEYAPNGEIAKAFPAYVYKRSDSIDVARGHMRRHGCPAGGWVVIVDQSTGEEV